MIGGGALYSADFLRRDDKGEEVLKSREGKLRDAAVFCLTKNAIRIIYRAQS